MHFAQQPIEYFHVYKFEWSKLQSGNGLPPIKIINHVKIRYSLQIHVLRKSTYHRNPWETQDLA